MSQSEGPKWQKLSNCLGIGLGWSVAYAAYPLLSSSNQMRGALYLILLRHVFIFDIEFFFGSAMGHVES